MDKKVLKFLEELRGFGANQGGMWNIPPETGNFLNIQVKASKAKSVLEIGMSNGYSTIWMAEAVKEVGGSVTTLENSSEKVRMAQENFKKVGLDEIITIVEGDAPGIIETLPGPFDFVFMDVWNEDYVANFQAFFPKLSVGGLIVADNAIGHSDGIEEYLQLVRGQSGLQSVLVPIGNGEEMTLRYE